jgi:tetratricopeptide (TPR) repeat protein
LAPLRRAVEMRPEHAPGLVSLGRLLVLGADRAGHEEAVALLLRAVALEPALAPAWGTLGGALNQTRRFDETVRLLEAAPAAAANAEAQFNLGVAYAALGDRAAAGRKLALVGRLAPPLARQLSDYLGAAGQVP